MNINFLLDSISNISIGNGTVYNFIDYIGEMHITGGILNYTRNYRFLEHNLFNNFSEGTQGRYGYGRGQYLHSDNLESKQYYSVDRSESNIEMVSLSQDKVGEIYSVPNNAKNSKLSFLTESGFITLSDAIRAENLKYNIATDIFKRRYGYYNQNAFIASGVSFQAEIGDYSVDTGFRKGHQGYVLARKTLKDNKEFLNRAKLVNESINKFVGSNYLDYKNISSYYDDDYYKVQLREPIGNYKSLSDSSKQCRDNLFKYRIINKVINDSIYGKTEIDDNYSVPFIIKTQVNNKDLSSGVIVVNKDIIEKNTTRNFGNVKGHYTESYGIKEDKKTVFYSILDKNELPDRVSIDPAAKGGSLVTKVKFGNNFTYTYFDEPDGKQRTSLGSTSTMQNFIPQLMSDSDEKTSSRLLQKTNQLFKENKIKSLINRFHTEVIDDPSEAETAYDTLYGMSRGRNLLRGSSDKSSGYDNPYCRVWTAHYQYSKLRDRIRPFMDGDTPESLETIQKGLGKLRSYEGPSHFASHTVLQNNGLVRVGPTIGEKSQNIQNFMFSIENLAWRGHTAGLKKTQVGPNNGRIMWFPPYNLKFSENINVQWQDNSFIGRGEKIYTYTNTERTGTLNFTLLVDHPSVLDAWRVENSKDISSDENEETILKFFAGCSPIKLKPTEAPEDDQKAIEPESGEEPLKSEDETYKYEFFVFFPNDFSGKDNVDNQIQKSKAVLDNYENNDNSNTTEIRDEAFQSEILLPNNIVNTNNFGLNTTSGFWNNYERIAEILQINGDGRSLIAYDQMESKLNEIFSGNTNASTQYEISMIETIGHASSHGKQDRNEKLSARRQEFIGKLANYFCKSISLQDITKQTTSVINIDDVSGTPDINSLDAKIARCARLVISKKLKTDANIPSSASNGGTIENAGKIDNDEFIGPQNYDLNGGTLPEVIIQWNDKDIVEEANEDAPEYEYFATLQSTDSLAYKRVVDKIKYFVPAFHSLTPEGFNERLNFLHQCTRQGPTTGAVNSGEKQTTTTNKMAGNLAFGRAPYCILRIGDFFNTKICIQSISYTFDSNGGVQWDLNTEGIGVQPMMADVSMNFTFIGGQDIGGVVDELQNAISENYYANSSVYNNRAKRENK